MVPKKCYDPQSTPLGPGVYLFRNRCGDVIYVGKAKILRRRLASYFQPSRAQLREPKLRALIHSIAQVEIRPTRTESAALLLEDQLIKEYKPRYNIDLTDDKRFLLVALDGRERFPRLSLVRVRRNDGRDYWGPFPQAGALRETVKRVSAYFKLRTCGSRCLAAGVGGRPCLEAAIGHCSAPCAGQISAAEYRVQTDRVKKLFAGEQQEVVRHFTQRMQHAATTGDYEEAATLRDVIRNLQKPQWQTGRGKGQPAPLAGEAALTGLGKCLQLPRPPRTIECFDVSNIAGCFAVGSMVCFQDGRPAVKRYRRFRIRSVSGIDDYAMMRELVIRRYRRLVDEGLPLPDLIMLDGGPGQLGAALSALQELGLTAQPVIALAKRHEEVFLPGSPVPLRLPRHHPALRLLQAVRDEAHRFALQYHHALRRKRLAESVLDEVPGVSRARRVALLREFGSVRQLRGATPEAIAAAVPGIGTAKAQEILRHLALVAGGAAGEKASAS
jgi:excinuclease ABC subunit C